MFYCSGESEGLGKSRKGVVVYETKGQNLLDRRRRVDAVLLNCVGQIFRLSSAADEKNNFCDLKVMKRVFLVDLTFSVNSEDVVKNEKIGS